MIEANNEIYPLSPMQQGMLYHALSEPHSGVDIEQLIVTMPAPVDAARLRSAWQSAAAQYAILRTAFTCDAAAPMQFVAGKVEIPFEEQTLGAEDEFAAILQSDRERGFAMDAPPLMRLRLFHDAAQTCRLVWTFHHGLLDGRSFPIVLREVFALYDDPSASLPPPPRPFRDFIEWHGHQDFKASEAYWRKALAGFSAPTPLAVDHLPSCAKARAQGDAETTIDTTQTADLAAFASDIGVTLNTLIQAAWAVVLSRYSGESDVCFGATRACRKGTIPGADEMVGIFINTVPVRTNADPETPVVEWLRSLRESWLAVRPHEHTPLARVQAWSSVPAGSPLFRSLVVFESYDLATHFRDGAWANRTVRLREQTSFPLCIAAYAGESLRLVAEFDRSHFDAATIARLLAHLRTVLTAFPTHRDKTIADLPLLPSEERASLLAEPAHAPISTPAKPLHTLFAEQAARTPTATALVQGDTRLTYSQLDRRANCIAAHLVKAGVGTESIVGLCMERTPALVTALLGILKANAAYLPIDLAYPADRLAFMLEDAQAPVLLTQRSLANHLPASPGASVIFIEDIDLTMPQNPPEPCGSDSLCYVLYTSGSTGKPKGCCVTHHNVARLFTATQHWFAFNERDVWTLFHSTAFDFSVWEMWGSLLHGGRLVVVPFEVSRSPELFHKLLIDQRVTVLNQTPSAFRQLIAADAASPNSGALSLRTVVFGGEALEMQSLRPWFDRHGDARPRLVNMYGITETTVHVTYRPLTAADVQSGSVIGEPIPDLHIFILDPHGEPVPIGVPGELYVSGDGLARGYLRRPDLTASRFIESPFAKGERLYRTGDLARWLPNRDIEYLGRLDHQVKIRGFRIELGEIESVLTAHPAIAEAAVLARDNAAGGKQLVAWFVPATATDNATLRAHLKQKLPEYMIPAAFVQVAKMPLTNNGKLDVKALPAPSEERPALASAYTAPRNTTEEKIAAIWQRVLKLDRIGVDDHFFELGGDSILSILVVAQCRKLGITITPRHLFEHPTIAALAAQTGASVDLISECDLAGSVPLTPIQRWFFAHAFADAHHWNQSFVFEIPAHLSDDALDAAFAKVFAAHPAFALGYQLRDGAWMQRAAAIDPSAALRCTGAASPADAAIQSQFSLDGPLLRFARHGELLSIAVHHLVMDGVSWRILLSDLDAALRNQPLAKQTTGFHTWSHALPQAANADALDAELPHWRSVCDQSNAVLHVDFPDGANTEASTETLTLIFTPEETAALLQHIPAGSHRVQDALLAALAHALSPWTGREAIIIEIEGHGREEAAFHALTGLFADLSHTIGWFTTIFPFPLRAANSAPETLALTAATTDAIPQHGFGFSLLRHLSRDGADPSLQSNAQVLFNYLGQFDQITSGLESIALANADTAPWHSPNAHRTHLLEINSLVIHGKLEVRFAFSRNIHKRETIERAATLFADSLRTILSAAAPSRFPLAKCDTAAVLAKYSNAEDILPLTPMQRLFLTLENARPGSGTDQWHALISGPLDVARLQQAWASALRRNPALRSAYISDSDPHAVVIDGAAPEWRIEDWQSDSAEEQARRFAEFLAQDSARPFDVTTAPLTRLALFRNAENEHRFVWTHHHLEIDGWSWPVLFREIAALYSDEGKPANRPYHDYIAWVASRPANADEAFWRATLSGFAEATPLPFPASDAAASPECEEIAKIAGIADAARRLRVTPNAIVQAAWALLLAHHSQKNDVVFGAALSGRPPELEGSADIIGHFVSNVPIRVRFDAAEPFESLVLRVHAHLSELPEHQYAALTDIQAWSDLSWNSRLFSSLVVFQNYVTDVTAMQLGNAQITDLHSPVRTNYPATLLVNPGTEFRVSLLTQPGIATSADVRALLSQFATLLSAICDECTIPVSGLSAKLPPPAAQILPAPPARDSGTFTAPSGETEKFIAGVWSEAFRREVGVTDNFFDLGGHSLLMLQVHARLSAKLGRPIPIVKLFQHPTIRSLAAFLTGNAQPSKTIASARDRAARARAALGHRPLTSRTK